MCGIVAYVGQREASTVLLKGLKRLEYRGYDSSGIALLNSEIEIYKKKGNLAALEEHIAGKTLKGNIAAHTEVATLKVSNSARTSGPKILISSLVGSNPL